MSHRLALSSLSPQFSNDAGSKTMANRSNFPILERMALYRLTIHPGCFREPHWHANADELTYCFKGTSLVTIFASGNVHSRFTISEGEMFFVPNGQLHSIENLGSDDASFVVTFSHEMPEDFGISGFAGCLAPSVLANTWNMKTSDIEGFARSPVDIQLGRAISPAEVPDDASFANPFKLPLEARAARQKLTNCKPGISISSRELTTTTSKIWWIPKCGSSSSLTPPTSRTSVSPGPSPRSPGASSLPL